MKIFASLIPDPIDFHHFLPHSRGPRCGWSAFIQTGHYHARATWPTASIWFAQVSSKSTRHDGNLHRSRYECIYWPGRLLPAKSACLDNLAKNSSVSIPGNAVSDLPRAKRQTTSICVPLTRILFSGTARDVSARSASEIVRRWPPGRLRRTNGNAAVRPASNQIPLGEFL